MSITASYSEVWISLVYSIEVVLVMNLVNDSISLQFHIIFDEMLYNFVIVTVVDTEVGIRMDTSRKSLVQVML